MTTPVNPYLTTLAVDSAPGAAAPGGPCARPSLRNSTSRAPVSLAVALRTCSFLQRRPTRETTQGAAECAQPDGCARAGTCVRPNACPTPVAESATRPQDVDAKEAEDLESADAVEMEPARPELGPAAGGEPADVRVEAVDGAEPVGVELVPPAVGDTATEVAAAVAGVDATRMVSVSMDGAGGDGGGGAEWAVEVDAEQGLVCAEPAPPFGVETPDCVVRVDEPGELIAGVPAMIGFAPERSLVVLVLRAVPDRADGAIIDAVMRFDLDQEGGRGRLRAEQVARCVAQVSAHDDVAEVLAVVVDDRSVEPDLCGSDIVERCGIGRFDMLIAALARRLAAQDIALAGAWAVRAIRPGQCWWSLFGMERSGLLSDPATSAVALAQVLDGRPVLASRTELTAMVAEDSALQDEVAALLETALAVAHDRYARAVRRGDPNAYSRQALEYVLWQVANIESDNEPMARELAELAAALRDRAVRDAMFALAVGDHAVAAEALWAILARALRGRDRAEAAALLGYSAYARGDGALAGIALEAALAADPDHPMALLLETSLSLGMRPEQMRRLARSGYHAAADLGIDLGEPAM
ncbi:DUF4192 domain-containing protein [Nocardia brasiliensis]|nr:DUF4192 domain-containing protein [Nocardia brasiliensis]